MVNSLLNLQYDKTGHIVSMTLMKPEDAITHSEDISDVENFLTHHGVLGMHWGKHLPGRNQPSHNSPEHDEIRALSKKPLSQLTTAEIQKINARRQAESKFRQLNPSTVDKGHNQVKKILAISATITAIAAFTQTPIGKELVSRGSKVVSKILQGNGKHSVNYVAPVVKTVARHL